MTLIPILEINLARPCPFWKEDLVCTSRGCAIETLETDPDGWEQRLSDISFPSFQLDTHLFRAWNLDENDFCFLDRDGENGVFVDLVENPERFTGYSGPSAARIWESIYQENCFLETKSENWLGGSSKWNECVERQIFYKLISGFHASISVHLADHYFNQKTLQWESNREIYMSRVGNFPDRKQNLYFAFTLLVKAVKVFQSRVDRYEFNQKDPQDDFFIKNLMDEFKERFRNVTRIMDCISCERCRLWGKIQTTGIGTALKILTLQKDNHGWYPGQLRRTEIVALLNTFGRLSESVLAIKHFEGTGDGHAPLKECKERIKTTSKSSYAILSAIALAVFLSLFMGARN